MPEPYTGWTIDYNASKPEDFGWTEVLEPGDPPDPKLPRKFVKINGGQYDWIWYPAEFSLVALAYSCGFSDNAVSLLGVRPRYDLAGGADGIA